jgi:hypothetical protein
MREKDSGFQVKIYLYRAFKVLKDLKDLKVYKVLKELFHQL